MIKVTYHAGERFLQRVFQMTRYTKRQVIQAIKLIEKDIKDVQNRGKSFVLPSFPKFSCIVKDNALVTIIPK